MRQNSLASCCNSSNRIGGTGLRRSNERPQSASQAFALRSGLRNIVLRPGVTLDRNRFGQPQYGKLQHEDTSLGVRTKAKEPVFLGEPVKPILFRHLLAGKMLARPSANRSNSANAVPRCVVSFAPCRATSSRTRSGRSRTMQPRVAWAAVRRKSLMNAEPVITLKKLPSS